MNIFDQILASGYYAFNGKLNSHIVRMAISFLRKNGVNFRRDELVMHEIHKYMYFDMSHQYVLRDEYTISDLGDFIEPNLITLFHNLKKSRDKYYSGIELHEEPTFESAIKLVKRM